MQKLLVSGIFALCAMAGYAQNVVTTNQMGTANSAMATQGGSSLTATISQVGTITNTLSNTGVTNQTGTGHTVTVNQNNGSTFNQAYATQKNGTTAGATGANSATISQSNGSGGAAARGGDHVVVTGDVGNFSGTFQVGSNNKATVNQDGTGTKANLGEISQQGTSNTATTSQSGGAKSNVAQTFQGYGQGDVTGNMATINQDAGTANVATVNQFGNNGTVLVDQFTSGSSSNTATVDQVASGNMNEVKIYQGSAVNGDPNIFGGGSTGNKATVYQAGSKQFVEIYQGSIQPGLSSANVASVSQVSGSENYANIGQYSDDVGAAERNSATILQSGFHGDAVVGQAKDSDDNVANITQGATSTNNIAASHQNHSTNGKTTITQNLTTAGSDNIATINQGAFAAGTTANSMTATISQEGSNNVARLKQTGSTSGATITQSGNNNVVRGPGSADSDPNLPPPPGRDPNVDFAVQDGTDNTMTVTQTAPATGTLSNNAFLSQVGNLNTLTVNQTISAGAASGNMAMATQTGMNNQAIVQQTAMP